MPHVGWVAHSHDYRIILNRIGNVKRLIEKKSLNTDYHIHSQRKT